MRVAVLICSCSLVSEALLVKLGQNGFIFRAYGALNHLRLNQAIKIEVILLRESWYVLLLTIKHWRAIYWVFLQSSYVLVYDRPNQFGSLLSAIDPHDSHCVWVIGAQHPGGPADRQLGIFDQVNQTSTFFVRHALVFSFLRVLDFLFHLISLLIF